MPGAVPDGEPVPADGNLPDSAYRGLGERPFGIYVHVPFCATRCGYCDFNTYTAAELGGRVDQDQPGSPTVSLGSYPALALAEVGFARKVLGAADVPVRTVFFGGGTPTLMPPAAFGQILRAIDAEFGLAPGAEVTTEANPESVDEATLSELRAQGVNRVSFGMQSAVPGVLAVLDRVHQPGRPARCAEWAREAGFEHVSLDLIYGTPGESDADWRRSLEAAIAAGPDHVSAYALTVEADAEGGAYAGNILVDALGYLEAPEQSALDGSRNGDPGHELALDQGLFLIPQVEILERKPTNGSALAKLDSRVQRDQGGNRADPDQYHAVAGRLCVRAGR